MKVSVGWSLEVKSNEWSRGEIFLEEDDYVDWLSEHHPGLMLDNYKISHKFRVLSTLAKMYSYVTMVEAGDTRTTTVQGLKDSKQLLETLTDGY